MTNNISSIKPFASGHTRARWVLILLAVVILLDLVAIGSDYAQINLLSRAMEGETITIAEAEANDSRQAGIAGLQMMTLLVTAVLFLMWIHRSHRNLPALGAHDLKYSPGWAVGYFFIPILNLFRPYQVVEEIWKASDPNVDISDGSSWQNASTSPVIGLWWVLWLISGFVGYAFLKMSLGVETVHEILTMSWVMMGSDIFSIAPSILLLLVIRAIDSRQEQKSKRVATLGTPLEENEEI